jgi:hypothetical protein
VIIEITDDGNGAWNLTAKTAKDAWPPMLMAYGRSAWAIKALVHGILTDHAEEAPETSDSCTCTVAGPDPKCVVHHGRQARGPKPPPVGPGCICDGSGRSCPRHGAVI